jgi:hypothetical protein
MTHVAAPKIASNHQSLPNQPFFAWLRTQTALFVGQMLMLLGAVYSIVALVYYISGLHVPTGIITPKTIGTVVVYSHLLFLTVFIVWLIKILNENQHGAYRASRVYKRLVEEVPDGDRLSENEHTKFAATCAEQVGIFKRWFLGFWCAMLFLYIVFAVEPKYKEFYPPPGPDSAVVQRLNKRLQDSKAKFNAEEDAELSKAGRLLGPDERRGTLIFPFLAFMANNVSLFFIFGCFSALYLPAGHKTPTTPSGDLPITADVLIAEALRHRRRQKNLWLCFGGLLVLFTLAFPGILWVKSVALTTNNWSEYVAVFDALSGTLNAVVVALMIARFDSKLIGLPPWLISILYFYSGVQPLFVVFDQSVDVFGTIRTAVLIVVFIFKVYFFLIILYSLQNGRLLNYFYCSYLLNKQVNGMRINSEPTPAGSSVLHKTKELVKSLVPALEPIKVRVHSLQKRLPVFGLLLLNRGRVLFAPSKSYVHWILTHTPGSNALCNGFNKLDIFLRGPDRQLIVAAIFGWLGIIYFVVSLLYYAVRIGSKNAAFIFSSLAGYILIFANLVALSIIIVLLIKTYKNNHYEPAESDRAKRPTVFPRDSELVNRTPNLVRRFRRYFLMFWLTMFAFYVVFALQQYLDDVEASLPPIITSTLQEVLVVPNRSMRDFRELPTRTSDPAKEGEAANAEGKVISAHEDRPRILEPPLPPRIVASSLTYSWLMFLMNNLMVLFVFLCFTILYVSAEDRRFEVKLALLRNYSILICTLLTMSFPLLLVFIEKSSFTKTNLMALATIFAAVGGILNAVAFALLIARLDSRLIRLPTSVISVLYSYSALQTLFVVFAPEGRVFQAIETSALVTALIFKICLVLIITHAWQSGRFEDYLVYFPFLNKRVNSIFDNQFEIRIYGTARQRFKYSIFKENVEKYKTEESYPTRVACDLAVGTVRDAMKKKANYGDHPQSVHGTYWVQVKNLDEDKDKEKVICESTSLRSEAEARELIEESIEMVPHCKYDRG